MSPSASPAPGVIVVLTTLPVSTEPGPFARALVEDRLAACVNVLPPMTSCYRWKDALEEDAERQVIIKTTRARLPALEARIRSLHPYEVPELLVLQVSAGSAAYLSWVAESVAPPGADLDS